MFKIKTILINLGKISAIFLMLSPFWVLDNIEKLNYWYLYFIFSICYDIYIFSIIEKENSMENEKKHYYSFVKNAEKKLNLKLNPQEKIKNLQDYIERLLNNYF